MTVGIVWSECLDWSECLAGSKLDGPGEVDQRCDSLPSLPIPQTRTTDGFARLKWRTGLVNAWEGGSHGAARRGASRWRGAAGLLNC